MVLILDLAVLAVLALCAWRGSAKGLVLTLCSLLAVVVGFVGAFWISDQFSEPVSKFIQPYIQSYVEELLEAPLAQAGDTIASPSPSSPGIPIPSATPGSDTDIEEIQATLDEVLNALGESELFSGLFESVSEAVREGTLTVITTAAAAVAGYISLQLARTGLFLLSFVVILVVWWLLSHTLDLAFRLPVLRTLNKTGGLLLGLVKGILILLVACWALLTFDIVTQEVAQQTYLFRLFLNFQII